MKGEAQQESPVRAKPEPEAKQSSFGIQTMEGKAGQ